MKDISVKQLKIDKGKDSQDIHFRFANKNETIVNNKRNFFKCCFEEYSSSGTDGTYAESF